MAKSIIVYGRDLGQMRKYAGRITKHLGMKRNEGWGIGCSSFKIPAQDTVIFFEWALSEVPQIRNGHKAISFAEVAKQINDAIPLTPWRKGTPPAVGEWNASIYRYEGIRRWWGGEKWSLAWSERSMQGTANNRAGLPSGQGGIYWRGLSEEPILVKP